MEPRKFCSRNSHWLRKQTGPGTDKRAPEVAAAEREQAVTAEARAARKQLAACKEKLAEVRGPSLRGWRCVPRFAQVWPLRHSLSNVEGFVMLVHTEGY